MPENRHRIGRGRGHHELMVTKPRRGAVVKNDAILAQHQAIAALADRQGAEGIGVDAVEEGPGIGALDVDLAQGGYVADAHRPARRQNLPVDRLAPFGFPGLRHPLRA